MSSLQYELKGLYEQRSKLRTELEGIGTTLKCERRAMNPEERDKFGKLTADLDRISDSIAAKRTALDGMGGNVLPGRGDWNGASAAAEYADEDSPASRSRRNDERTALSSWFRVQRNLPVSGDDLKACERVGLNPACGELELGRGRSRIEKRALTITTSGGGYMIAQDFANTFDRVLVSFSGIRNVAKIIETSDGAPLPYPTADDTSNTGELLAINTAAATADPSFASVTLGAYKFSSKVVLVPNELIQDSAFDIGAYIGEEIATRIGRIQSTYFATGTGSGQPKGVVAAAAAGVTAASATAFTADELMQLSLAVDPAYSSIPGAGYMMKNDVLGYCMMLKDADGRPLLRDSYKDGMLQPMINGFPVYVNQAMSGLTSGLPVTATKYALFGDFKRYVIRDAGGVRMMRMVERYGEYDQVGFLAFLRSDANCTNTAAVKYLVTA